MKKLLSIFVLGLFLTGGVIGCSGSSTTGGGTSSPKKDTSREKEKEKEKDKK